MKYEAPEMEILYLEAEDVITLSLDDESKVEDDKNGSGWIE